MLALRTKFALALCHKKRLIEGGTRLLGEDDAVDESALRRTVGVRK